MQRQAGGRIREWLTQLKPHELYKAGFIKFTAGDDKCVMHDLRLSHMILKTDSSIHQMIHV